MTNTNQHINYARSRSSSFAATFRPSGISVPSRHISRPTLASPSSPAPSSSDSVVSGSQFVSAFASPKLNPTDFIATAATDSSPAKFLPTIPVGPKKSIPAKLTPEMLARLPLNQKVRAQDFDISPVSVSRNQAASTSTKKLTPDQIAKIQAVVSAHQQNSFANAEDFAPSPDLQDMQDLVDLSDPADVAPESESSPQPLASDQFANDSSNFAPDTSPTPVVKKSGLARFFSNAATNLGLKKTRPAKVSPAPVIAEAEASGEWFDLPFEENSNLADNINFAAETDNVYAGNFADANADFDNSADSPDFAVENNFAKANFATTDNFLKPNLTAAASLASQQTPSHFVSPTSDFAKTFAKSASVTTTSNDYSSTLTTAAATEADDSASDFANDFTPDSAGAVAIPRQAPLKKFVVDFKINKPRLMSILRYTMLTVILAVSGYLAWDTWMTNRAVQETFEQPAAALETNVEDVDPASTDTTTVSAQAVSEYTVPPDQPRYIRIAKLGVNSRVLSVGVTSAGNIGTPNNVNDTAWYDGSAKPGVDGAIFIDGHKSFSRGLHSIFDNLAALKNGDIIEIERGDGQVFRYSVVDNETIAKDKVDMNRALSTPDGAKQSISLMTCAGTYNYQAGGSTERTLVRAVLVG